MKREKKSKNGHSPGGTGKKRRSILILYEGGEKSCLGQKRTTQGPDGVSIWGESGKWCERGKEEARSHVNKQTKGRGLTKKPICRRKKKND